MSDYPSDLKEKEWKRIEKYFEPSRLGGRTPIHSRKMIVNAVMYVLKSGCQWRMLPKDFPPRKTVYDHFRRWNLNGLWEKILDELNGQHRAQQKKRCPSYGIIDSQSVKTVGASEEVGIDGGKKVKGRKRHIVVDTLGNLLHVEILSATAENMVRIAMIKLTLAKLR